MIELDLHVGWFILGGVALLAMTTLPQKFSTRPLSLPIVYVLIGFLAFEFLGPLFGPDPLTSKRDSSVIEYVTELIVIVSLASAGLKLDRAIGLVSWSAVWRLLSITMVATVAVAIVMGFWFLGLGLGAAVLLGAVVAPTDPVLADDVQVAEAGGGPENEVRFTLTAEAGLNDGLAFPIAHLAVAIAAAGGSFTAVAGEWLAMDVGYRIAVGVACGVVLGRLLVYFSDGAGHGDRSEPPSGLFVLGATIVVYGLTELVNGYGFLAVFVAALARGSGDFRTHVSRFADDLEKILLAFVLLGFGALLSEGILDALTWRGAAVAMLIVLVVRPIGGAIALIGSNVPRRERIGISFFGIRGMGSLYYLAWAANEGGFPDSDLASVWAVTTFAIIVSIIVHGVTASPLMRRIESRGETIEPDHAAASTD